MESCLSRARVADRLVYGLGQFRGYDSGDPTSREVGLYDQSFVDRYIHNLANGFRLYRTQKPDVVIVDLAVRTGALGGLSFIRRPRLHDAKTPLPASRARKNF